jgi:hypothetical protein
MAEVCHDRVIDLIGSGYNKKVLSYAWLAKNVVEGSKDTSKIIGAV